MFRNGEIDAVYLLYNEFKSVVAQKLTLTRVLPLELPEQSEPVDYIFEQPAAEMLDALLPKYVEMEFYRALLESAAAEHAARMTRHGRGHLQRRRHDRQADSVYEPRAPGQHHQGNHRSGQRRRGRGVRILWQRLTRLVIGKVVQVAGPAVDCEFPEGQIPLVYTAIRITSEGFDVPHAHRYHLRSGAAHRRRPRAHHRAAAHRGPGARHEGRSAWAIP